MVPFGLVTARRKSAVSSPLAAISAPAPLTVWRASRRARSGGMPSARAACSISSASRNTYAGPLPETAVTGSSSASSSTQATVPIAAQQTVAQRPLLGGHAGRRAGDRDALTDRRRRVRHRPHDGRPLAEQRAHPGDRAPGHDREENGAAGEAAIGGQSVAGVLRFDGQHDGGRREFRGDRPRFGDEDEIPARGEAGRRHRIDGDRRAPAPARATRPASPRPSARSRRAGSAGSWSSLRGHRGWAAGRRLP